MQNIQASLGEQNDVIDMDPNVAFIINQTLIELYDVGRSLYYILTKAVRG